MSVTFSFTSSTKYRWPFSELEALFLKSTNNSRRNGRSNKKKKIKIKDFKSAKLSMTHEEIKHNAA